MWKRVLCSVAGGWSSQYQVSVIPVSANNLSLIFSLLLLVSYEQKGVPLAAS